MESDSSEHFLERRPPAAISLAVLYEDSATHDHAESACNSLAACLRNGLAIKVSWWRLDSLVDPRIGWEATETAVAADMIVFAMHSGHDVPAVIRSWVESWADSRAEDFGAVVDLLDLSGPRDDWVAPRHHFIKQLAERAHMEYLAEGHFDPREISSRVIAHHHYPHKPVATAAVQEKILSPPIPSNLPSRELTN